MALAAMTGPQVLVLDAGNALFANGGPPTAKDKDRAAFILQIMGKLGTKAMAAGHHDLFAGTGFLDTFAKKAGVTVLSANLRSGGKQVFPAAMVIDVAGLKVGLVGLSPPGPVPGVQGLEGAPTLAAVKAELAKFPPGLDVKVVLAATPYADALQLAGDLKGAIDLVLQSGDLRPAQTTKINQNYLATAGERGRAVQKVTLKLDGTGAFVDLDETMRSKELLDRAEANLKTLDERLKVADGEWAKSQLNSTIAELTARRNELKKTVDSGTAKGARTVSTQTVNLEAGLGEDPEIWKQVLVHEPLGKSPH